MNKFKYLIVCKPDIKGKGINTYYNAKEVTIYDNYAKLIKGVPVTLEDHVEISDQPLTNIFINHKYVIRIVENNPDYTYHNDEM